MFQIWKSYNVCELKYLKILSESSFINLLMLKRKILENKLKKPSIIILKKRKVLGRGVLKTVLSNI